MGFDIIAGGDGIIDMTVSIASFPDCVRPFAKQSQAGLVISTNKANFIKLIMICEGPSSGFKNIFLASWTGKCNDPDCGIKPAGSYGKDTKFIPYPYAPDTEFSLRMSIDPVTNRVAGYVGPAGQVTTLVTAITIPTLIASGEFF